MNTATATVIKRFADRDCKITITVTARVPDDRSESFIRCSAVDVPEHLRVYALSGARFARRAVDPYRFCIDILAIQADFEGQVDGDGDGAAIACAFATWKSLQYPWRSGEVTNMHGWELLPSNA